MEKELKGMRYVCGVLAKKIIDFYKEENCPECDLNTFKKCFVERRIFFLDENNIFICKIMRD